MYSLQNEAESVFPVATDELRYLVFSTVFFDDLRRAVRCDNAGGNICQSLINVFRFEAA